jgi:uncharacterized membrane protein YcaP (DUF421 family)
MYDSEILHVLESIFGPDTPPDSLTLAQTAARAVLVFVLGVAVVRLGKSRLISRWSPLDVILGFILGSLLSRGITGHASLSNTIAASMALVFCHWVFTYLAYYWHGFGNLVKGHSKLVISDGKVLEAELRHSNISTHDLFEALRMHGIEDVKGVKRAYKERNGEIGVIRAEKSSG